MKPPVVISTQKLFEGKVFDVERDRLRFEDGRKVDVDIVRHRRSVVLIPLTDTGSVILVRQYRHAVGQWMWELPAGTTDPSEDVETAAARECHEEIGLRPEKLTRLGSLFPTPGFCDEEMVFFLAEDLRDPGYRAAHDEDEQLEPFSYPLEGLADEIARGQITDMKTVCGLELLRKVRGQRTEGRGDGREEGRG